MEKFAFKPEKNGPVKSPDVVKGQEKKDALGKEIDAAILLGSEAEKAINRQSADLERIKLPTSEEHSSQEVALRQETESVISEMREAGALAKSRLQQILKRIGRAARPFIVAGGLLGATSFTEACATASGGQRPEVGYALKSEAIPDFEDVKKEALLDFDSKKADLAKEIGEENLVELRGVLERFDAQSMKQKIEEEFGVEIDEGVRKIALLTEAAVKKLKKEHPDWGIDKPSVMAMCFNDELLIKVKGFVRSDGKFDAAEMSRTLYHELNHVFTTDRRLRSFDGDQKRIWTASQNISPAFNEGVTELMRWRLSPDVAGKEGQAYAGGEFMAAYLVEQLVGTKVLGKDYFSGKSKDLRAALDEKLGIGAAEKIFANEFGISMGVGFDPEGLATVFRLVKLSEARGIDVEGFFAKARFEGIKERVRLVKGAAGKVSGVFFTKEIEEEPLVYSGVLEAESSVDNFSPQIKVFVIPGPGSAANFDVDSQAKIIKEGMDGIKEKHDSLEQYNGTPDEADAQNFFEEQKMAFKWRFNATIRIKTDLRDLFDRYRDAKNPEEKSTIFVEIFNHSQQTAERILKELGKKIEQKKP